MVGRNSGQTRGIGGRTDIGSPIRAPMAEPPPNKEARHRLRQSLTRHLLDATAGVAFASALMFLGFGHPLDWVARLSLTTAFLGLGGVAFALRRDAGTVTQGRALPYVIGAAIGLSG